MAQVVLGPDKVAEPGSQPGPGAQTSPLLLVELDSACSLPSRLDGPPELVEGRGESRAASGAIVNPEGVPEEALG